MSITLKEVALAAGVSTAAVSKVLHGRAPSVRVSEQRAAHIREIAAQMQYRPNAVARNLRSSRTHTVGLIFENFWNISEGPLYYLHLLDGVASPLFRSHYRLTILPEIAQDDIFGSLCDGQLEGVVWCKMVADAKAMGQCTIPVVAMSPPPPPDERPTNVYYVSCDERQGLRLAIDHLVGLGHEHVVFLREWEERENPDAIARSQAFLGAAKDQLASSEVLTWGWDFSTLAEWWAGHPRTTAVICWSESAAGRLLARCAELGISVPGDLSVIGFDSTQYCDTTSPTLTAVRQPIFEMARSASETLLAIIRGDRPESFLTIFPCGLDVRDSTARPRLNAEATL